MLIASTGIAAVLAEVMAQGFRVLGIEGFKIDPTVRPQLDMIVDNTTGHPLLDPATTARSWGKEIWVDVALAQADGDRAG